MHWVSASLERAHVQHGNSVGRLTPIKTERTLERLGGPEAVVEPEPCQRCTLCILSLHTSWHMQNTSQTDQRVHAVKAWSLRTAVIELYSLGHALLQHAGSQYWPCAGHASGQANGNAPDFDTGEVEQQLLNNLAPSEVLAKASGPRMPPQQLQMLQMLASRDPGILASFGASPQVHTPLPLLHRFCCFFLLTTFNLSHRSIHTSHVLHALNMLASRERLSCSVPLMQVVRYVKLATL